MAKFEQISKVMAQQIGRAQRISGMNRKYLNGDFEWILQLSRDGNDDALSSLLEIHGRLVRSELQIAPIWQASIDADDVMQVTYMEAFLRIGSFAGSREDAFHAWIVQLAKNNLLDAIRALEAEKRPSPKRRVAANNGDSYTSLCEVIGASTPSPGRAVSIAEIKRIIDDALGRLPHDYAEVIRLLDLQGLSGDEVAERLSRSRAAVYMLAGRARDRLRELLGTKSQFFSR